ncbi:TetR/AcrR family transcriptional regulator C-terminal ligand-binding domain-containing protein [Pseudonocardia sp. KRD-184]|uniref:TetR/AcrR family transcriptional regulator C-terminal ligand-binding domain-containing protein n=1 Tax=Pseudonocardia oceani TaxID=2792013 RepID=A0ABS6UDL1_9PSEU|nr:TetR/AcrR family transcriptional regulator C-terminal ligand-binding domain-containing protein [Pseudonocardia oceani]MBW0097125.1 TetR/AcrR family transcriptional regulator C-terminal ligand-binding domain-containing protein [Pseudonocardia oceani]MBW0123399.1 TetR/AcrR family transcriptional regulator C-terminal ligand-binding domain-containing protein [Pseudonocardia oceani]MBW0130264.1 TetR/AcrR family transcriptional regulator C-terminal ligand-binding domain-containing protein [Pseudono
MSVNVTRGRPRDPDLERRVHDAVLEVYWETGWAGFTLDAVARRARVGRAALYSRWSGKAALLVEALEVRSPLPVPVDTGSARGDLVELARQLLDGYTGAAGLVTLRAAMEARVHPDLLAGLTETLNSSRLLAAREIVRRGVGRGELPEGTPTTLLLELVTGAVLSHVLFAPSGPRDPAYADVVVDAALRAVAQ